MISLALILILIAAVAGSGLLSGWMVWMMSRTRRLETTEGAGERGALTDQFEELTHELARIREQLDQLEQRTDFNERLLEGRGSDETPTIPAASEE